MVLRTTCLKASLTRVEGVRLPQVPVGPLGLEKDPEGDELVKARAQRSYVDQGELNEMAEEEGFGTDDVALLGRCRFEDVFRERDLKGEYAAKPVCAFGEAFLLSPDDDVAPWSAAVVSALCAALGDGEVYLGPRPRPAAFPARVLDERREQTVEF